MGGVKHNIAANLYGTGAVIISQMALVPLFIQCWGQDYYGEWIVLSALPAYLALSDGGLSNALGNQFTILVGRGENVRAQDLISSVWRLQTWAVSISISLFVAALTVFPLQDWVASTQISRRDFYVVQFLLAVSVLLPLQTGIVAGFYRAANDFPRYVLIQGHARIVEFLGTAALLWFSSTMVEIAAWMVLVRALWLAWAAVQARHLLPAIRLYWGAGTWRDLRTLLPASTGFFAFPIGNALINHGVTLVVNNAGGSGQVVLLSICRQIGRVYLQISSIFFSSLHPELTTAYARSDIARMRLLQSTALFFVFASGTFFCLGAFFLGEIFVQLWPGLAVVTGLSIGLFSVEAVATALSNLSLLVPWAISNLRRLPIVYLSVQAASLILSWILFPFLGISAVGIAFLFGNMVFAIIALRQSLRQLDCGPMQYCRIGIRGLFDAWVTIKAKICGIGAFVKFKA